MVPQRDWNCTEYFRHIWHTGKGWQCAVQLSGAAESRSTTGSVVQHQGWSAVNRGICAHLQGKGFLGGSWPGWGWGFCSWLGPQGCSVVFPEINSKPQVCLSLFHLEQVEIFFSTQNYLRIPCREDSESKPSETFPSALLWLIYNIESVYGVQLLIWYTSVLQNYHHHSFVWQLNHVP